ncbi:MAG: cytochrome P450 [Porticoccaceae bacterium]|nr:cytochrome P450 [Porticoccaceae bacterium]
MTKIETQSRCAPANVPQDRIVEFDLYAPPGGDFDPFKPWFDLRDSTKEKIVWSPENGGHWIVLDGSRIAEMIADSDLLSSRKLTVPPEIADRAQLIPNQVDPPAHKMYRSAIAREFSAKYLAGLRSPISEIATSLVQMFRDKGRCDFIAQFSEILPIHVFLHFVGLPKEDAPMLRQIGSSVSRPDGSMTPQQFFDAIDDYLDPYVRERLAQPGEDLFSRILANPLDGREWTLDEAKRTCRNLMLAGLDSVSAVLGYATLFLARNPGHQEQIRANPSIIPAAADELIRRYAVVILTRQANRDFEFDGVTVRKDDLLLLPTPLHNLDSSVFECPEEVRFDRAMAPNSTFGGGIHRCVGSGVARLELMIFLELWHQAIPTYRIDPADRVEQKAGSIATVTRLPLVWDV